MPIFDLSKCECCGGQKALVWCENVDEKVIDYAICKFCFRKSVMPLLTYDEATEEIGFKEKEVK